MSTKSKIMSAVLAALAIGASSAFAASAPLQLARHGADDLAPPPACDDNGTDLVCATLAKGGDDGVIDDKGVDFVIGKGGDDGLIDDNGIDFVTG
jgi:hypothetical protein